MKANTFMKCLLAAAALMIASAGNAWAWGHGHSRVYFGVGFGPGYWGPSYYYPGYYYPPYAPYAPVVINQTPPVYIEQTPQPVVTAPPAPQQQYWYYCKASRAYYPYVKTCPAGWMKVLPQTPQ